MLSFLWNVHVLFPGSVETDITQIFALTQTLVNVAALSQGSSCTYATGYMLTFPAGTEYGGERCDGSLNGILGDAILQGGGYIFIGLGSSEWIKVQFRGTFLIKMMGLAQRPLANKWHSVTLEDSNGASQVVPLTVDQSEADYGLYGIQDMNTQWIKLSAAGNTRQGATALEFYADKTGSLEAICLWNPTLLSSSSDCEENWNKWSLVANNMDRHGYMEFQPGALSEASLSALSPLAVAGRTSTWGGQIGFKVQHSTIRSTRYGDCRMAAQGPTPGFTDGYNYVKTCVQVKWISCHQGTCKVKKTCFLQDADSITASKDKACMTARCDDQCTLS